MPIIALDLLLLASCPTGPGPAKPALPSPLASLAARLSTCEQARGQYQALELEDALATAAEVLATDPTRPLECLELKALVHLILNQHEDAKTTLVEIFERSPDRAVDDPSLSPATRESIAAIRESVRPLAARLAAGWIVRESLRIDLLLEGGLRDAARVRYRTEVQPAAELHDGEVPLLGRAATATVAVATDAAVDRMRISGQILDGVGRVLHQFSSDLLLPPRPESRAQVVEVERGGVPWPVWAAIVAAAVIGASVTIGVVAQRDLPDSDDPNEPLIDVSRGR